MATRKQTLRQMRLDKRLTQSQVAGSMGISQAHYSAVERGKRPGLIAAAMLIISRMRLRSNRTKGGSKRAGRLKG